MKTLEYYQLLDSILNKFLNSKDGFISRDAIFNNKVDCPLDILPFLEKKGYIKEIPSGFYITFEGKCFLSDGGFVGEYLVKRETFENARTSAKFSKAAAVIGVIGLIISLVALLVQL